MKTKFGGCGHTGIGFLNDGLSFLFAACGIEKCDRLKVGCVVVEGKDGDVVGVAGDDKFFAVFPGSKRNGGLIGDEETNFSDRCAGGKGDFSQIGIH